MRLLAPPRRSKVLRKQYSAHGVTLANNQIPTHVISPPPEDVRRCSFGHERKGGGGRNVAKGSLVLLSVVLASALARAQVPGGVLGGSEPDLKTTYVGSAVTCSQSYTIVVPRPLLERAKLKARLAALLRESLYDDAKGIVNMPREKEIRKLASKLKKGDD
jgi:hypothetical protein